MKLNKIFTIALAAVALTACSSDEDYNTSSATVVMEKTTMEVSEDLMVGVYYKVPVQVIGETNGPVKVTVDVDRVGETPAVEDEHYLVTSKTIVIPKGENIGYIEFYPTGDEIINEDRLFSMTITAAEGATIGEQNTCVISLLDNDYILPEKYEEIQGSWSLTATSDYDNTPLEFSDMEVWGLEEGETGYLKTLYFSGWEDYSFLVAQSSFSYDVANESCMFVFLYGQTMADDVNFGSFVGRVVMGTGYYDEGWNVSTSGSISATSNSTLDRIEFDPDGAIMEVIYRDGSLYSFLDVYSGINMKR